MRRTNKHLWDYRELKPIRFLDNDIVEADLEAIDLLWHRVDFFVGVELKCIDCNNPFSFSAAEQKTWRHEWGFSIHSYPKKCKECRKTDRIKKALIINLCNETKDRLDDLNKCNKVVGIIKQLYELGVSINKRHGEKLLYFVNRSEHRDDEWLKCKLLHRIARQCDTPEHFTPVDLLP
jgi:hypothetical protein